MSVADTVADKLDAALDRFHKALASTDDDEIGKAEDAVFDQAHETVVVLEALGYANHHLVTEGLTIKISSIMWSVPSSITLVRDVRYLLRAAAGQQY
ncbi:hypothetical protein OKHIL_28080 [Mycolicibacterium mageritense]